MKKVSVTLPDSNGGNWGSIKTKFPKDSAKVRFVDFTGTSKNFDTDTTGVITKRPGGINFNSSTFTGAPKDIYEAIFANGTRHMLVMANGVLKYTSGGGTFTDVTSGYTSSGNMEFAMYQDRVYFGNGIDTPQTYDIQTTYGGVVYAAPRTKQMGAIIPSAACTAPGAGSAGGSVPAGAHTYKITYLYYGSEESNGNTASGVCTVVSPNQTVALTNIPVGGYGVTARKVYRDNNDGNWLLVGTISNNTATTYNDTAATGTTAIPTDNGMPPVFAQVLQYLDRLWVAGVSAASSTLYFSAAGKPDIFPSTSYIVCNPRDPIIGMLVYSGKILILNRNSMGWILGRTTDTFRYEEIPSSVGCVDNRSIQIRTSRGVPTAVWLSDKGLYEFNGSSINYVSEAVEDQLNVNIQQASQVKGKNTQDTTTDFTAGTASAGITISGGVVSQANPKRVWDDEADWEGGSSLTNVATNDNSNQISVPTLHAPAFSGGSHNNTVEVSGTLRTALASNFTGESHLSGVELFANSTYDAFAQSFVPPRAGTVTSITHNIGATGGQTVQFAVYTDSSGSPLASIYNSGTIAVNSGGNTTVSCSVAVTGGTKYWLVVLCVSPGTLAASGPVARGFDSLDFTTTTTSAKFRTGGSWTTATGAFTSTTIQSLAAEYVFSQNAVAASGVWVGPAYDSKSDSAVTATVTHTGSFPSGCSSTTTVEGSNDSTFSSGVVSSAFANQNGTNAVVLSAKRYWRIKLAVATTDDRNTAQLGLPTLTFNTTATWISEAIDHTTDITALNSLVLVSTVPGGTSVTAEVATSADNITYSAYTAIGSATPARYTKVRITLTSNAANVTTSTVTSVTLRWTVVSTLISSAIDTGATPVGWELFTAAVGATGTVSFSVRTAATSGTLGAAAWVAVTSGTYITATVFPFIQWRATLTSTADAVASVDSVVVNWFISATQSIRVASIFDGLSYYLTAAEYGQTTNNIVFKLDDSDNFRVYRGVNINCYTFFFNDVYYGKSTEGRVVKWLTGLTDQGTNIELDLQSAAVNYGDLEHTKILRKVYVTGKGTGAVYTPQYSIDNGTTWKSMINPVTGLTTFTTTDDDMPFIVRLQPNFAADNATGKAHIFRLVSNDANECQIQSIKFEAWIRMGEPN